MGHTLAGAGLRHNGRSGVVAPTSQETAASPETVAVDQAQLIFGPVTVNCRSKDSIIKIDDFE